MKNQDPAYLKHLFLLALSCMLLFSCTSKKNTEQTARATGVKGIVRISGAWALYPLVVRWGEEFRKAYPDIRVDVSAGGAGKGVADTLSGFVDLGMVSRELKPEEVQRGAVFVPVAKDAVFPAMNAKNPAATRVAEKGMGKKAFLQMWVEDKATTWGELSGMASGNRVRVYTRSDACGAAETWAQYLGKKQEDLKGVGVYGDPGISEAVVKDADGIGYNNLNYAFDAKTGLPVKGLMVIPVDANGNGKTDPEEDLSTKAKAMKAVASGIYPSPPARDLYLAAKGSFKGSAALFVRWILTEGQKFVDEVGYIAPTERQITDALVKVGK